MKHLKLFENVWNIPNEYYDNNKFYNEIDDYMLGHIENGECLETYGNKYYKIYTFKSRMYKNIQKRLDNLSVKYFNLTNKFLFLSSEFYRQLFLNFGDVEYFIKLTTDDISRSTVANFRNTDVKIENIDFKPSRNEIHYYKFMIKREVPCFVYKWSYNEEKEYIICNPTVFTNILDMVGDRGDWDKRISLIFKIYAADKLNLKVKNVYLR
jgi:hypothetical protein